MYGPDSGFSICPCSVPVNTRLLSRAHLGICERLTGGTLVEFMVSSEETGQLESLRDDIQIRDSSYFKEASLYSNTDVIQQDPPDAAPNNMSENLFTKHSESSWIDSPIHAKSSNPVKTAKAVFDHPKSPHVHLPFHTENLVLNDSIENSIDDSQEYHGSNTPSVKTIPRRSSGSRSKSGTVQGILSNPRIPYVLSLYLQLFFNVIIVSLIGYFVYTFVSTVRADVEHKIEDYAIDVLQEISVCSREYIRNNCDPSKRVPALEKSCLAWEKCMNRDPALVGRAKIGAETFAEIVDGLVKPISWKTIFFLLLLFVGSFVLTNTTFGSYRKLAPPTPGYSDTKQRTPSSDSIQS